VREHPTGVALPEQLRRLRQAGVGDRALEFVAEGALDGGDAIGRLTTDLAFRVPLVRIVEARSRALAKTWVYDFRWKSPVTGLTMHCLDLPFSWGNLDAPGVPEAAGARPPAALGGAMHSSWVAFVRHGDPGWTPSRASITGTVFDGTGATPRQEPYTRERSLADALGILRT
jgi:para-nitrobenzyl esterase